MKRWLLVIGCMLVASLALGQGGETGGGGGPGGGGGNNNLSTLNDDAGCLGGNLVLRNGTDTGFDCLVGGTGGLCVVSAGPTAEPTWGACGGTSITMPTARLLGRTTAGTGAPENISLSTAFTLSALTLDINEIVPSKVDSDTPADYGKCAQFNGTTGTLEPAAGACGVSTGMASWSLSSDAVSPASATIGNADTAKIVGGTGITTGLTTVDPLHTLTVNLDLTDGVSCPAPMSCTASSITTNMGVGVLGRTSTTGVAQTLTGTQVTTLLSPWASGTQGVVPASGLPVSGVTGGTANMCAQYTAGGVLGAAAAACGSGGGGLPTTGGTMTGELTLAATGVAISGGGLADCDVAPNNQISWDATNKRFSCSVDVGGGTVTGLVGDSGTPATVDAAPKIAGGLGLATASSTATTPDSVTVSIDYTKTQTGNPTMNPRECIFTSTTGGLGGGGILCEGSGGTVGNEQLYLFPQVDDESVNWIASAAGQLQIAAPTGLTTDCLSGTGAWVACGGSGVPPPASDNQLLVSTNGGAGNFGWQAITGLTASVCNATTGKLTYDGNTLVCGSDAGATGTGDVDSVGDCVNGACFNGVNTQSTWLGSVSDFSIELDDDNNDSAGARKFVIRDGAGTSGAGAAVLTVTDTGATTITPSTGYFDINDVGDAGGGANFGLLKWDGTFLYRDANRNGILDATEANFTAAAAQGSAGDVIIPGTLDVAGPAAMGATQVGGNLTVTGNTESKDITVKGATGGNASILLDDVDTASSVPEVALNMFCLGGPNRCGWQLSNQSSNGGSEARIGMIGVTTNSFGASTLFLGGAGVEPTMPGDAVTVGESGIMTRSGNGGVALAALIKSATSCSPGEVVKYDGTNFICGTAGTAGSFLPAHFDGTDWCLDQNTDGVCQSTEVNLTINKAAYQDPLTPSTVGHETVQGNLIVGGSFSINNPPIVGGTTIAAGQVLVGTGPGTGTYQTFTGGSGNVTGTGTPGAAGQIVTYTTAGSGTAVSPVNGTGSTPTGWRIVNNAITTSMDYLKQTWRSIRWTRDEDGLGLEGFALDVASQPEGYVGGFVGDHQFGLTYGTASSGGVNPQSPFAPSWSWQWINTQNAAAASGQMNPAFIRQVGETHSKAHTVALATNANLFSADQYITIEDPTSHIVKATGIIKSKTGTTTGTADTYWVAYQNTGAPAVSDRFRGPTSTTMSSATGTNSTAFSAGYPAWIFPGSCATYGASADYAAAIARVQILSIISGTPPTQQLSYIPVRGDIDEIQTGRCMKQLFTTGATQQLGSFTTTATTTVAAGGFTDIGTYFDFVNNAIDRVNLASFNNMFANKADEVLDRPAFGYGVKNHLNGLPSIPHDKSWWRIRSRMNSDGAGSLPDDDHNGAIGDDLSKSIVRMWGGFDLCEAGGLDCIHFHSPTTDITPQTVTVGNYSGNLPLLTTTGVLPDELVKAGATTGQLVGTNIVIDSSNNMTGVASVAATSASPAFTAGTVAGVMGGIKLWSATAGGSVTIQPTAFNATSVFSVPTSASSTALGSVTAVTPITGSPAAANLCPVTTGTANGVAWATCGSSGVTSMTGDTSTGSTATGGGSVSLIGDAGATQAGGIEIQSGTGFAAFRFEYDKGPASQVTMNARECMFSNAGSPNSGGGLLCEGGTGSNDAEQLHLFVNNTETGSTDVTDWIVTSATAIGPIGVTGAAPDATNFLRGDGQWAAALSGGTKQHYDMSWKSPVAGDDVYVKMSGGQGTLTAFQCMSTGATVPTNALFEVFECDTAGASCATTNAAQTLNSGTNPFQPTADTTITGAGPVIEVDKWIQVKVSTGTMPSFAHCRLEYTQP